jgi:peptide/nickel transport system permease protein
VADEPNARAARGTLSLRAGGIALRRRITGGRSRRRSRHPVALYVAGLIILIALVGVWVTPDPPNLERLGDAFAAPSWSHPLGVDSLGRDTLSRILAGAKYSVFGALLIVVVATFVGTTLGALAGFRPGGLTDMLVGRSMDLVFSLPPLLLAIAVVAVLGPGFVPAEIALCVAYSPYFGRFARNAVLTEASKPYRLAAQALGLRDMRILWRHVFPPVIPLILSQALIGFGYAILDLASLSFLGLGVQPPNADWGGMVAQGATSFLVDAWPVFAPAAAIAITVLSLNLGGDWARRNWSQG